MGDPDPLRALLDAAPFGIALVDRELRYLEVNAFLARVHGRPAEQHLGLSARDVVPAVAGELERHAREVLRTGKPVEQVRLRGKAPSQDEDAVDWLVGLYPVEGPDGTIAGVGAVVLDVTAQVRTAEELALRTRQQAVVARFGQRALAGVDVDVLAQDAVTLITETLDVEFGEVLELLPDGGTLVMRAGVGWRPGIAGQARIAAGPETQAGYVLAADAPVIVEDLERETRFTALQELREHGVVSGLSVIIESQGRPFGVLAAHSSRRRNFSTDDIVFLQSMANVLGAAVERGRVEARMRQSAERLRLAMQAGRLGAWEWDMHTGEVRWSEILESIAGLPPGGFGRTTEAYRHFVYPGDRGWVLPLIESAAREQRALPEFEHRLLRPDGSVRWVLCNGGPMHDAEGRMIGMLGLAMDITERKETEEERTRLLAAEHAARTEAEAARERLAFLAEVTAVMGTTLDVRELLTRVTELAVGQFSDCCAVDLLEDGRLRRLVLHHRDPAKAEVFRELRRRYPPRPGSGNPLFRVLETGEPFLNPVVREEFLASYAIDEGHLELLRRLGPTSGMCIPLAARGRALGVLSFVREDGRSYSREELEVAADIGRRLALAIDNARLFQERTEGERRFRRLADTLQSSLLPPHMPEIPGLELAAYYRPAATGIEVGGDFYDVFPLQAKTWGLVIGDVCGKGPEAASLTAFARYTLRTAAIQERVPSQAIAVLNHAVLRDGRRDTDRFLTVAFLRLRMGRQGLLLSVSLGGHPQPLLVRADGTVTPVGTPGTVVGVIPDPELNDDDILLGPGDTLFCYTDGVPDARTGKQVFGDERLVELLRESAGLSPQKVVARVEEALLDFGAVVRDDVAILCLRVPPSPPGR